MISFIVSLLIVALGQSAWLPSLGPLAASFGYCIFWRQFQGRFWLGTLWFSFVQLIQLSWMTAIEFQGIYILAVWCCFSIWLGVQFGIITALLKKKPTPSTILGVASFWTFMEWGRMHILCGFSFNPVGLSLATSLYAMQFATLFGILGLSFWVMLVNLTFLSKRFFWGVALAVIPYIFGVLHLKIHEHPLEKTASVALIQTGLLPSEKTLLQTKKDAYLPPFLQWQRIVHYLQEYKEHSWDYVLLPEAAVPFSAEEELYPANHVKNILKQEGIFYENEDKAKISNLDWVKLLSEHFGANVIAGLDGKEAENYYAAGYHVKRGVQKWNRYEKRILVPLAEYLPFSWLKPLVASYGILDFFKPGKEAKVFEGTVPFAVSICYEETFPHLMREGRLKGAELFINLTNDNWYPSSRLPLQHFDLGRLRTVENGVPLLRACNSGVTAAVDSLGRTVAVFEGKAGLLSATIDLYSYKTLYMFWGNGGIISFCFFFIALFMKKEIILPKKLLLS